MTYQTQQAYGPFTADFGRWTVTPTSRSHVHVDANHHAGSDLDSPDGLRITIRGIPYGVSAHLYPDGDGGGWIERAGSDGRGDLYASRLDRYTGPRDLYPSRSALDAIRSKLYPAVAEWLNGPEGKAALELAERVDANNRIDGIDAELAKVAARAAELRAERKVEVARFEATERPY